MVELNGVRTWAVAARGAASVPRKLACGTLARPIPASDGGDLAPPRGERMAVPGRPDVAVAWTGWFELMTGEVVGVYGAVVEPVG